MLDQDQEASIKRVKAAVQRAREETDSLPLSIPSPLRDQFFSTLMEMLTEDRTHRTDHCEGCRGYALNMALSALGWQDRRRPRPSTVKDRMDQLFEQVRLALRFLDQLHKEGLRQKED